MKWMEKAPAKINLALDVLYKREDGFHEVEMVMTNVDLADRIELAERSGNTIRINSHNRFVPDDSRNLAYQAADLLKRRFSINTGVDTASEADLCKMIASTEIELKNDGSILLDGKIVTNEIRTDAISMGASNVSAFKEVRALLVAQQQKIRK